MTNEFEPYQVDTKSKEFSIWDLPQQTQNTSQVDQQHQVLLDECEQLRQQAVSNGYAEGMQQAQQEIVQKKAELAYWINAMQKPMQHLDEKLTQEIIQTIIWLTEHCIHVQISAQPNALHTLLSEIKQELPSLRDNQLFAMNPEDVEWLKTEFSEQEIPGLHQILHPDPSLLRGDFYLRGEHSELDGRIRSRLATLFSKYINKELVLAAIHPQE
jgi:flagellar assembly protein FliH